MSSFLLSQSTSPLPHDLEDQRDQDHHQQHLKLFIAPHNEGSYSQISLSPTFFHPSTSQDQRSDVVQSQEQPDQKEVIGFVNSNTIHKVCTNHDGEDQNSSKYSMNSSGGPEKYWMSSNMRLIQKMSNPEKPASDQNRGRTAHKIVARSSPKQDKTRVTFNFSHANTNNNGTGVRVCSDCSTTTTPLWRSGPRGPKSLCNACGIRQRKARRAMAEAAAASAAATGGSVMTSYDCKTARVTKEKKSRTSHMACYKSKFKLKIFDAGTKSRRNKNELCFGELSFGRNDNDFAAFSGVFPKDVAEAAFLLMELSCHHLVHA